jgi:DNA-directed RNA polymerase specialized sigma24 family protein
MGGLHEMFLTTHWSQLDEIQKQGDRESILIGQLLERYWRPVYCYLRRKGYANDKAKDLTQGFFCDVVLDRNLVARANPTNGSFRSLLLHALRHYVIDSHRRETSGRRIPKEKLQSIDRADSLELPDTANSLAPEESFNYAWKADLMERALSEVKERLIKRSMDTHWHAFHDRVLQPAIQNHKQPTIKEVCTRFGIENEAKASQMIQTVKRNLQNALGKIVRQTVSDDRALAEEMVEILKFLED